MDTTIVQCFPRWFPTKLGALDRNRSPNFLQPSVYQKRFCTDIDARAAVTIQNAVSLVIIGALAVAFETMHVEWTGEFIFALAWSGIALSVIALALYFFLVQRGAAAQVTSLIYLSPPTTAVMGWLMFGETFAALAMIGMAIAVAGVALVNR